MRSSIRNVSLSEGISAVNQSILQDRVSMASEHSSSIPRRELPQDSILVQADFIRHLRLEKRRADRSLSPLSMILFRFPDAAQGAGGFALRLADVIFRSKRETDIVGHLAKDVAALLLPHTDGEGAESCLRNVRQRIGDQPFTVEVRTYPDELFENLANPAVDHATQTFLLDISTNRGPAPSSLKRGFDIVGSIALLMLTFPILILTAVAIAATSPGPVIFRQTRLGKGGAPFGFLKFRSMYTNADDQIHREYVASLIQGRNDQVNQGDEESPYFKIKADPRITRVGRFIRTTSIDELPQLFNVLMGDMSLVGPRPPLTYEAEKYNSWHLRRIVEVRPGITGLWQVEGRSRTTFDEMVRLDLRYVREWSPLLDIKILLRTVLVVVRRDGAN